jgi:hypothetical protein
MKQVVTVVLERQTKGAALYREVDREGKAVPQDAAVLRSIYIRKSALNDMIPQELTVTISDAKA